MLNRNDDDARLAGRLLSDKLVFALIAIGAILLGGYVVTDIILPAFAQIDAAFSAVAKN
jgi:hypothetical protein